MAIDDRIGKHEAYMQIFGQKPCQGEYPGDVPKLEIPAERVDDVYLIVKKMQRCYHNQPGYPTAEYYAPHFARIEEAYLSQDWQAFKLSVIGLMIAIDAD